LLEYNEPTIRKLDINEFPRNKISRVWLHIINNGLGEPIRIPLIIARGPTDGPTFGMTSALHGNELNGIAVIQQLFSELDIAQLSGTLVGVLIANPPGLVRMQRDFNDGVDLNHVAPGNPSGNMSQLFMHRLIDRIVERFDYLVDLHTASFGRVNTYYIRANMKNKHSAIMARLQNPEIILDNPPNDYTLRGHASARGIHSITPELQDPHQFQHGVIRQCLTGLLNQLIYLKMIPGTILCPVEKTTLCDRSYWVYTDEGGFLKVLPQLGQIIEKDQPIAEVQTVFGKVVKTFCAPERGIVIGKSTNPINQSGSRILHLGINPCEIECVVADNELAN
jgi:predicted deacylase